MLSIEVFSELLTVLYSAPLDEEQWQHFLKLLSRHTHSVLSVFLCADNRLGLSIRAQGGTATDDRVDASAYNERYARSDPFRAPAFRNPRPRVVQGDDLLPNNGLLRTTLYRDLLAPQFCRYATLILLTLTVRRIEVITIWRSLDQGPMDQDCNRLLNLLLPHIQQALEIRQVLGVTKQRLAGAEAMADASSTATFLLTRQGHVVHSNATAGELLSDGRSLMIQEGVLVAKEPQSGESLNAFLGKTALSPFSMASHIPAYALSLQRNHARHPLHLLAIPLSPTQGSRTGADILLLVTDPEEITRFPDSILRALYDLTPAETEVANGLLMGCSLEEIASLRRVALGTVRMQVKSLLGKTETTRQSELIRLLTTLPQLPTAN